MPDDDVVALSLPPTDGRRPHRRPARLVAGLAAGCTVAAGVLVVAAAPALAAETLPTYQVSDTVPVGNYLSGIAVDPSTHTGYVTDIGASMVRVLDLQTNTVTASVPVGANPYSVAVDPSTHTVYATSYTDGTVTVIDGTTDTVTTTITTGPGANNVAVDPSTHRVFVANSGDRTVSTIDGTTDTVTARIGIGGSSLNGLAVDVSTHLVYVSVGVSTSVGYVAVVDPATNGVSALAVAGGPYGLSVDPTTHRVYVAHFAGQQLSVIDTTVNSVSTIPTGKTESSTAVDPTTHTLFVTDYFDRTVSVYDTTTDELVQTLPVGRDPNVVALDPTTRRAYTANQPDGAVSVIRIAPAATSTTLAADNASLVTGQPVTFTASVAAVDPDDPYVTTSPSGTVAFTLADGSTLPGCGAVAVTSSEQAQCTVAAGFRASAGSSVSVTATYSGDYSGGGDFATSSSDALVLAVDPAQTLVSVTGNPDPPVRGQVTTFTAVVAPVAPGAGTPMGQVRFAITTSTGRTVDCTGGDTVELAGGTAQCVTPKNVLLGGRTYTVDVAYSGDADFAAQTGSLDQTVNRAPTSVDVTTTPSLPTTGTAVTVKAQVRVEDPGAGHPNGTATFTVTGESGDQVACQGGNTVALTNQSSVTCVLPAGSLAASDSYYTVGVYYAGSRSFSPTYSQRGLTIKRGTSTTTVSQSSATSVQGTPVTFTATVAGDKQAMVPFSGTVTFTVTDKAGNTVACDGGGEVAADGTSSCTVAGADLTQRANPYTVTAVWSGDEDYAGSQGRAIHRVTRR